MKDRRPEAQASAVTNTTAEPPEKHLLFAMDDAIRRRPQGSFIEDMEAQGQRELVRQTSQLPTKGSEDPCWAKVGVVFGEPLKGDEMWRAVTLPAGWKLEGTDHAMWSKLKDEKGRVRASIFYKAAFYDRSCHMHAERRYVATLEFKDETGDDSRTVCKDTATGAVLFAPEWQTRLEYGSSTDEERRAYYAKRDADEKACKQWLTANYPDWENPAAYWD